MGSHAALPHRIDPLNIGRSCLSGGGDGSGRSMHVGKQALGKPSIDNPRFDYAEALKLVHVAR